AIRSSRRSQRECHQSNNAQAVCSDGMQLRGTSGTVNGSARTEFTAGGESGKLSPNTNSGPAIGKIRYVKKPKTATHRKLGNRSYTGGPLPRTCSTRSTMNATGKVQ